MTLFIPVIIAELQQFFRRAFGQGIFTGPLHSREGVFGGAVKRNKRIP